MQQAINTSFGHKMVQTCLLSEPKLAKSYRNQPKITHEGCTDIPREFSYIKAFVKTRDYDPEGDNTIQFQRQREEEEN